MSGGIYLIRDGKQLIEMSEQNYESEDLLQGLIAQYPNLLAGDQINSIQPRRWLLISRERGLPSEESGGHRWAVDHLFLDQDAIPTIVEVKRSSDTRIRREVVGQMLGYAANAVVYWPVEAIRAEFEARRKNPQRVIAGFLGDSDLDEEGFWQQTKTNLQAGKVRLVFVADEIPTELRRVVEFLNQQMDPTEVLAVEVKQYVGEGGMKALVPRVIGQTAEAERRKGGGSVGTSVQWNRATFFEALEVRAPQAVEPAGAIFDWAENNLFRITWGRGKKYGTFYPTLDHHGVQYKPTQVWTDNSLVIQFRDLGNATPFDDEIKRSELLHLLNDIPGIKIPNDAIDKYPSIALTALNDEGATQQFLDVMDWIVQEIVAS